MPEQAVGTPPATPIDLDNRAFTARIDHSELETYPFDHVCLSHLFPPEFYRQLLSSIPSDEHFHELRHRDALRAALADGTVDALVSDHTPVGADEKDLPFAEAEPGATGMELLWSLALKWGQEAGLALPQVLSRITADPARVLGASLGTLQDSVGHLAVGGLADVCVLSTEGHWLVSEASLRSQGKSTPFSGYELPGRVLATVVGGHVAFEAA